jgi:hypothetical protein
VTTILFEIVVAQNRGTKKYELMLHRGSGGGWSLPRYGEFTVRRMAERAAKTLAEKILTRILRRDIERDGRIEAIVDGLLSLANEVQHDPR